MQTRRIMVKIFNSRRSLVGILITFVMIILAQFRLPVLGWAAASTPQAYLPAILKVSTPAPTPTPTASPTVKLTSTPTATTQPPSEWLDYVNWLRSLGELPALTENPSWSTGGQNHAKYMVKNDYIGHDEDPNNYWYTADGAAAANKSDVMVSGSMNATDIDAIDLWMSGPFHGLGIIDPALSVTGFGSYQEADGGWQMGACLDVIRGLGSIPVTIAFPVLWPADNGALPYVSFGGNESPDPLTSCPGYTAPSGPPIFILIGDGSLVPSVTAHSFKQGSTNLESCEFDETNYTNPISGYQGLGRSVLEMRDAIVIMPRDPLTPGATYTVSITNSGTTYTWSFTVTGTKLLFTPNAEIR
jgi:uncharacterized protein YkwD